MFTIFGYSAPLLFGQLLLGLINGRSTRCYRSD